MTPPEPLRGRPATAVVPRLRHNPATAGRKLVESQHQDGWLMAVELVTATFTWGGIGFLVDHFWLGTYPVFMSIGFVVGFFAGMYLLWLKTSEAPATGTPDGADEPASATADATVGSGGNGGE